MNKKMIATVNNTVKKATKKVSAKNETWEGVEEYFAPIKTIIVENEWLCANVPCKIQKKEEETVTIKPFNKNSLTKIPMKEFMENFVKLEMDESDNSIITEAYPNGKINKSEFDIEPIISKCELIKPFKENKNFVTLLEKAYQDSYQSKGNTFCINMDGYNKYKNPTEADSKKQKLERIGDPYFNRARRHTPPVKRDISREEYEVTTSFPAPIGVRYEDFALPSEQNDILRDLLRQVFSCVNAPECPPELQKKLDITIEVNSHKCEWCGEKMNIQEINQEYCSKVHTVNFCHRDPVKGTKKGNVYIGHCSCNREQGGYSEEERIAQIIRLAKSNALYREILLKELN